MAQRLEVNVIVVKFILQNTENKKQQTVRVKRSQTGDMSGGVVQVVLICKIKEQQINEVRYYFRQIVCYYFTYHDSLRLLANLSLNKARFKSICSQNRLLVLK